MNKKGVNYMEGIEKIRQHILNGDMEIDDLSVYTDVLKNAYIKFMNNKNISRKEVYNLIMLYLDYYTLSFFRKP